MCDRWRERGFAEGRRTGRLRLTQPTFEREGAPRAPSRQAECGDSIIASEFERYCAFMELVKLGLKDFHLVPACIAPRATSFPRGYLSSVVEGHLR